MTTPRGGAADGAVAVVGVGCRLPGGICDLDGLWRALMEGADLVGEVPADRFDVLRWVDEEQPRDDRSYTRAGGFLRDVDRFDAAYFRISPKEAAAMDPQQRLLLEMTAEALDDAGIDPASLAGTDASVFVGISDTSYGVQQMLEPHGANAYTMVGSALSIAANRLSHAFDLRGPSMAVDTACSSSLLAVERACKALLEGAGRVALAGGVNLLISPRTYVGFSQAAMLSRRGRCAAFSAAADGFVRAEGGGVVVLKRLTDALADGDRVHGVVLAAGTNNDGRTNGLALPNADAQEALLRQLYERAGIDPDDLVYVEAHGTGTQAGDRAECLALGRALGGARTGEALPIGSVKSNLGHLEPASGMAGLLKALLVLRHGTLPASLHAEELNPAIDFDGLGLSVVTEARPLPAGSARPVVGVNSFGFGGSNVHVALTAPPRAEESPAPAPAAPLPVMVSARTPQALRQAVDAFADRLDTLPDDDFYDVAYTACVRRGAHPHRVAVLAASPGEAARELRRQAAESGAEAVGDGSVAFVFSGNGSQWAGMAADLLAEDGAFREAVEEVDAALAPHLGWSVLAELALPPQRWRLSATEVAQPMLFAVQAGLVASLAASGVRPAAVLGHSVGEVAAAYAAGALTLEQAALVIAARGTAQAVTRGRGRMAAVGLSESRARQALAAHPGLEIAAVNTEGDVTVAGPEDQLKQLVAALEGDGTFVRLLDLDYPFHSSAMDVVRAPLERALDGLAPRPARIPMISTVTGRPLSGDELTAGYWWRNVREPVLFGAAVEHVLGEHADVLVEIGPHPVLRSYLRRAAGSARRAAVVPTLRAGEPGPSHLRAAVAAVIACGGRVHWRRHFPRPGRVRTLPRYPWQRDRHWIGRRGTWERTSGSGEFDHPLLGERMPATQPSWHGRLERPLVPWLADHRIGGVPVMPATGYVEMALAAGRLALPEAGGPLEVDRFRVTRALTAPGDPDSPPVHLRTALSLETGVLTVSSGEDAGQPGQEHARARVRALLRPSPPPLDVAALRARMPTSWDADDFYRRTRVGGLEYGPAFRVLTGLWSGAGESLGRYSCPAQAEEPWHVHPVVLDSGLQVGVTWLLEALRAGHGFLPSAIGAVRVWRSPSPEGLLHVRERARGDDEVRWDVTVADLDGEVAVEMEDCRLSRAPINAVTPLARLRTELRAQPYDDVPGAPWPATADGPPGTAAGERLAEPARADGRPGTAVRERIAELRAAWSLAGHGGAAARFEEVFAHGLAGALAEVAPATAGGVALAELVRHGVDPRRVPMVGRALPLLERHGLAERLDGDRFLVHASRVETERLSRELCERGMPFAAEQALAVLAAAQLAPILAGRLDPAELFASSGGAELYEQVFDVAPLAVFANRVVRAHVEDAVRSLPADRPLRVLEVGGGSGGTAAVLLPVLPADRARYVFTDVAEAALARARRRFAAFDFVDYRVLDLDADPLEQSQWACGFDLVIATHVLHLARDPEAALRRLSGLLVPGGRLLAVEPHRPPVVALAGMVEGRDSVMEASSWPALLAEAGFRLLAHDGEADTPERSSVSVLLASAPGTRSREEPPVSAPGAPACEEPRMGVAGAPACEEPRMGVAGAPACEEPRMGVAGATAALPDAARAWVVVAEDGLGAALEALLNERGGRAVTADPASLAEAVPADAAPTGFVYVLGGDAEPTPEAAAETAGRRLATLRTIAGLHGRLPAGAFAGLWLVTRPSGAVPEPGAPDGLTHLEDAAAWGAARTLGNEQPELTVRRVSLHRTGDPRADAGRLLAELCHAGDEDEVVLTAAGRFVARAMEAANRLAVRRPVGDVALRLAVRDPGTAYKLVWQPMEPLPPGPGEVLVETRAVGLNYRDLVRAVNLLPSEAYDAAYDGHPLGLECAGVVSAVGPGVTGLRPGDRVLAMGPVGIATHATLPAATVRRIPGGLSFTEAATLPLAYATVVHALGNCARLRPGETLLVHGGAGGVGLAALAYARRLRARVIATAGSPVKRGFLRALGACHVLDSRGLDFAEEVKELTGGRGVDVVLNSLAGEALHRSLEAVAPGGRFVEIGKRDIYGDKPLLMRPFGDNIAFFGVDVGALASQAPERAAETAEEVRRLVEAGALPPLPHTVYPAARADDAFALMRQSRHLGKIVLTFDPLDEPVAVEPRTRPADLDPQGTYLVTGGLSGFGAATARWLADRGARHLALVGRRGTAAPEAAGLVRELDERGVSVRVHAADVTDEAAMRRIVAGADASGHPLRGIVHSAMHLDDDLLRDLTDDRILAVLRPKVAGALVLDAVAGDRDLDLFLLYSSITATLGHLGQAPYVAGNLFLEALARRRRAAGRQGLAVCLGAIGETGVLARTGQGEALARFGVEPVRPEEAFAAMEDMLADGATVAGVARCDWSRLAQLSEMMNRPRMSPVMPPWPEPGQAGGRPPAQDLAAMDDDQAVEHVNGQLSHLLAAILHMPADQISHDRRLEEYGMDSLMNAQMHASIRRQYGIEISALELLRQGGTVSDITRSVLTRLRRPGSAGADGPDGVAR
uniref:type I polyketide synthase n=1 Tax=Nonomuraea pusilla TaxID=46177 RepID=UPI0006E41A9F|nr:type I polyketide synthase [Nonomuraea pusilla]